MTIQHSFMVSAILVAMFQFPAHFLSSQSACEQLKEISGQQINCQRSTGSSEDTYQPTILPDSYYDGQYAAFVVQTGNSENQKGIRLFTQKKYAQALAKFRTAAKYLPDNASIRQNIVLAEAEVKKIVLKNKIKKIKHAINRDLTAVRQIGMNTTDKDFKEWTKLLAEEKQGLVYFFVSSLVVNVNKKLKAVSTLKRADARIESKVSKWLKKMDIAVPTELSVHLKTLEKDIKNVEKAKYVLTYIEHSMKTAHVGDKISKGDWLEIAAIVLEFGLKDPKLKLLMKGVNSFATLAKAAGVYAISAEAVEDLTNKTMQDLKQLQLLSKRIQKNTKLLIEKEVELSNIQ